MRAKFTTPLIVQVVGVGPRRRSQYRLERDLVLQLPNGGGQIRVPRGFVTDFASVPRAFWWLVPPSGEYTRAAVVHDFIYARRQRAYSRWFADAIFRLGMQACGVPLWKRWLMWAAVRLFGPRFKRRKVAA